jgi:hypothetical protein
MIAPLLASGWINQLHVQTPSPITDAIIEKVFHELSVRWGDLDISSGFQVDEIRLDNEAA